MSDARVYDATLAVLSCSVAFDNGSDTAAYSAPGLHMSAA